MLRPADRAVQDRHIGLSGLSASPQALQLLPISALQTGTHWTPRSRGYGARLPIAWALLFVSPRWAEGFPYRHLGVETSPMTTVDPRWGENAKKKN